MFSVVDGLHSADYGFALSALPGLFDAVSTCAVHTLLASVCAKFSIVVPRISFHSIRAMLANVQSRRYAERRMNNGSPSMPCQEASGVRRGAYQIYVSPRARCAPYACYLCQLNRTWPLRIFFICLFVWFSIDIQCQIDLEVTKTFQKRTAESTPRVPA